MEKRKYIEGVCVCVRIREGEREAGNEGTVFSAVITCDVVVCRILAVLRYAPCTLLPRAVRRDADVNFAARLTTKNKGPTQSTRPALRLLYVLTVRPRQSFSWALRCVHDSEKSEQGRHRER